MNETNSVLILKDLFFSEFSFKNDEQEKIKTINCTHKINEFITKNRNEITVNIETTITSPKTEFVLTLKTVGKFALNTDSDIEESTKMFLLTKNTVAIMLPFIRSQVSLITTQPKFTPILLQPLDVNKLSIDCKVEE